MEDQKLTRKAIELALRGDGTALSACMPSPTSHHRKAAYNSDRDFARR
jgi:hypothetical protein